MPFKKGHKIGNRFSSTKQPPPERKSKPKTKTLVKQMLGFTTPERRRALEERIDQLTTEFLNSRKAKTKESTFKDIIKYVHPQKKTLDVSASGNLNVVFYKPEKKPLDPQTQKQNPPK